MAKRYSDITRGPLLAQMYQRYKTWQDRPLEDRFQNVGNGGDRSPTVIIAVVPFGYDLPGSSTGYRVKSNTRNRGQLGTAVGARATTTLTDAVLGAGFTPAKVKMKVVTGTTVATSEITGRRYLKTNGESYLHPYGQTGTEKEYEAFEAIVAAATGANRRFSYSPERFSPV